MLEGRSRMTRTRKTVSASDSEEKGGERDEQEEGKHVCVVGRLGVGGARMAKEVVEKE